MSELHLDFCDKCFESVVDYGTLQCTGMDVEFKVPTVNLYHRECYATLTEQETVQTCTDCLNNPCFIRKRISSEEL